MLSVSKVNSGLGSALAWSYWTVKLAAEHITYCCVRLIAVNFGFLHLIALHIDRLVSEQDLFAASQYLYRKFLFGVNIFMSNLSEEKEYKWFEAAKSYEQILKSGTEPAPFLAETWQKIGFCYSFASRQATDAEGFNKLRLLAVSAYEKAAELISETESVENGGKKALCLAIAEYTRSWVTSSHSEKAKTLDKCRFYAQKAIEKFKESGNNQEYSQSIIVLLQCLFDRLYISATCEEMNELAKQATDLAEEAISATFKTGNKEDILLAHSLGSLQNWYAANISESEEKRKEYACKAVSHAEKAIDISKEVESHYLKAISRWAGVFSSLYFTEDIESSLQYAREMLEQTTVTRDNYLMGIAYYLIAHVLDYKVPGEANPDKRKQMYDDIIRYSENGVRHLDLVFQDTFIADTYLFPAQAYSALAYEFAVSLPEKFFYSKKAIDLGKKSLDYAMRSGASEAMISALHGLSKAYYYHSNLEPRKESKPELLRNALSYRKELIGISRKIFPSNLWTTGVALVYAAEIEKDLYAIEQDAKNKPALLQETVADIEEGVLFCKNWISSRDVPTLTASVAGYEDTFGGILEEVYWQTSENEKLQKANQVYGEAAEGFKKVSLPTRVAEAYWKIARNLDHVCDYEQSAGNFEKAFAAFKAAAQKIVKFGDFYVDYALYMKAWSEIESAKRAHAEENYFVAMEHYEKTSQLLRQSKLWMYLSLNFYAWSLLEQAEDCSRKENSRESIEAFEKAAKFFQESKRILTAKLEGIERKDEKDSVKRLIHASDVREEYSRGRVTIEEARELDKHGDPLASSRKYESAASIFHKISIIDSETAGKEAKHLVYLCRAWQKMTLAEAKGSPIMYEEAAELFKQASENSSVESAGLLALGHSNFCKALEAGTEFEMTRSVEMYVVSSKYFDNASKYYLQAGLESASEYSKATQRLFDAHIYVENAKRERNPQKQTSYYSMAEKALHVATESFAKANYQEKAEKVQNLLRVITEEKQLSVPLNEVFRAPVMTSTTSSFSALSLSDEKAVGLERFEHADIQVLLTQHETDIKVGTNFSLEIQFVNVGKQAVLLNKIENIVPNGFQLVNKPDYCSLENMNLAVRGKRLEPLNTSEIQITLKSFIQGAAEIKPRIVCVDDVGRQMVFNPEPAVFNVSGSSLAGRVPTGYPDLDNLLFGGLPENYTVILASPSIDERDLLVKKFLETGAKNDQTTFFMTVDPGDIASLAEEHQSNFYLFICSPRAEVLVKSLPNVFKLKGVEILSDLDIAFVKAFRMIDSSRSGPKRACITVVSDVLLQHHAVATRKWLSGLLPDLKAKGFTTLVVINPQMHPPEEYQAILGLFEGEIRISEKETENGLEKLLRIRKLYNQRYLENEISLTRQKLEA